MSRFDNLAVRRFMINEMCDAGCLTRAGESVFEDLGGNLIHEDTPGMDECIESFLEAMDESDRNEILKQAGLD